MRPVCSFRLVMLNVRKSYCSTVNAAKETKVRILKKKLSSGPSLQDFINVSAKVKRFQTNEDKNDDFYPTENPSEDNINKGLFSLVYLIYSTIYIY